MTWPASVAEYCEDAAVADAGVVTDVGVGHDEAVGADAGDATSAFGAAGDGDVFADGVVVADLEASGLAGVFEVLRGDAETGEGEDAVVAADGEVPMSSPPRTTWETSSQLSPRVTLGPMVQYGPIVQVVGI